MITAVHILLAFLSLVASVFCFGNLLASCAGHVPTTFVGMWIIPLSLLGGSVFLYVSKVFWKMRQPDKVSDFKKEARSLHKKVGIFLISFIAATFSYFLLSSLMVTLIICTKGWLENWIGYVLLSFFVFVAIYVGIVVYRKLTRLPPMKWLPRMRK